MERKLRKMLTTRSRILICNLDMEPLFVMEFYGITQRELRTIPGGGDIVARALERRGIDPHSVTFTLWDTQDGPP
jgi:hypothetical protein